MMRRFNCFVVFGVLVASIVSPRAFAADDPHSIAMRHLAAGEFAAAKQVATRLPETARNLVFAQIADSQAGSGYARDAAATSMLAGDAIDGRAGGGAIADFDSLMNLIQQTVVPETWQALNVRVVAKTPCASPRADANHAASTGLPRSKRPHAIVSGDRRLH